MKTTEIMQSYIYEGQIVLTIQYPTFDEYTYLGKTLLNSYFPVHHYSSTTGCFYEVTKSGWKL